MNRRPPAHRLMRLLGAVVVALSLLGAAPAPACPMCKGSLSPEEELKQLNAKIDEELKQGREKSATLAALRKKEAEAVDRLATTTGFFWSILFMLAAPALIFLILATRVVWAIVHAPAKVAEASIAPSVDDAIPTRAA